MKRENTIIIIILILVVSSIYTLIHHGEVSLLFIKKMITGEYSTEICISNIGDSIIGTKTAYCDGRYYYYDSEKQAICDWESREILVNTGGVIEGIGATNKYLYVAFSHSIHQYDLSGNEIADYKFTKSEAVRQMSIDECNVYCEVVEMKNGEEKRAIYVFDKEKISQAGNIKEQFDDFEQTLFFYEDGTYYYDIKYNVKRSQDFFVVTTNNQSDFEVDKKTGILKIHGIGEGEILGLFNCETKSPLISSEGKLLAMSDGKLYTAVNNISCLSENGRWEDYSESLNLNTDLFVAASTIVGDELIVNMERYFREDRWYKSPYSTIGYLKESKILYINIEKNEVEAVLDVPKGSVVYMDAEKYAVMNGKKVVFYSVDNKQILDTHKIKGLSMRKTWEVEKCGKKLFFICDERVVDCIDL